MRALLALLLHTLLAALLFATGPARAHAHEHAGVPPVLGAAVVHDAGKASTHTACASHRIAVRSMAAHGSTPGCRQACLALSAGFSAVLPVQAHALRPADGASPRPDAHHALPTGRVVMPERRPPRAA